MPIIYSTVARGRTPLVQYAVVEGNFGEVTDGVLKRIPPADDRVTYTLGTYCFHYIREGEYVYLCVSDQEFARSRAFLFLNEIKRRFVTMYDVTAADAAIPYAMNAEFGNVLATEMRYYTESRDLDKISQVHGELEELKEIMVRNIDSVAARGERLDLLVNTTDNLRNNSVTFRTTSRTLARQMYWRNVRIYVICILILVVVVYTIVSLSCGGITWHKCLHPSS